jgi:hypothetical protein
LNESDLSTIRCGVINPAPLVTATSQEQDASFIFDKFAKNSKQKPTHVRRCALALPFKFYAFHRESNIIRRFLPKNCAAIRMHRLHLLSQGYDRAEENQTELELVDFSFSRVSAI